MLSRIDYRTVSSSDLFRAVDSLRSQNADDVVLDAFERIGDFRRAMELSPTPSIMNEIEEEHAALNEFIESESVRGKDAPAMSVLRFYHTLDEVHRRVA